VLCPIANAPQGVFLGSPTSSSFLSSTTCRHFKGTGSAPVSQSSSHGSTVMLSDYDWAFCYSAYYPSYAGRRGDGKWHDRKKVKIALHHRATARGHRSHLFVGFMHGSSFGDRSRLLVCMATNYYAGTSGFSREFKQLLQASSVQCSTAQKVHYLSTSTGPT